MNKYRLKVELLPSSSSLSSSPPSASSSTTTAAAAVTATATAALNEQQRNEQQQQQQQQCEEGLIHDYDFPSMQTHEESFDLYVQSMHLYQETPFEGQDQGGTCGASDLTLDSNSNSHSTSNTNTNLNDMEHETVCEHPPLPLIAIPIPIQILQYIDDPILVTQTQTEIPSKTTNVNNTDDSISAPSLTTALSSILSKIHPSLSYLEPWGLLRSLPRLQQQSINANTNTNTKTRGNDIHVLKDDNSKSSKGQNTFTVLLLKLNHFDVDNDDDDVDKVAVAQTQKQTQEMMDQNNNNINSTTATMQKEIIRIIEEVNGEAMEYSPTSVIQALPISNILFTRNTNTNRNTNTDRASKIHNGDINNGNSISHIVDEKTRTTESKWKSNNIDQVLLSEIPLCPVCRFRIEPRRLGLELPKPYQRCSHIQTNAQAHTHTHAHANAHNNNNSSNNGSSNNNSDNRNHDDCCKNMQFLAPWTYPDYCEACHILEGRLSKSGAKPFLERNDSVYTIHNNAMDNLICRPIPNHDNSIDSSNYSSNNNKLNCYECGMEETLWVCLSCGVVGCGRYTHGHAEQHYMETSHPFSLELATQRIWDYATSSFVNRDDLLNCKFMQQILGAMNRAAYQGASSPPSSSQSVYDYCGGDTLVNRGSYNNGSTNYPPFYWDDGSTPKKAVMVGEEYEALLQSALEDQAQHFDLEIAHLQAQLATETLDKNRISAEEMREVEELEGEIAKLHTDVELLSREYVDIQAEEVGHRAKSNSLLREQGVSKQLLDKIREEADREHREGKLMVEELEQQISDLTANIKMRKQFADHEELNNAQIYGTSGKQKASRKKGFRRSRR